MGLVQVILFVCFVGLSQVLTECAWLAGLTSPSHNPYHTTPHPAATVALIGLHRVESDK